MNNNSRPVSRLLNRFVIPILGTVLFLGLLSHKSSDYAVVFNMYSSGYAALLALVAVNVALLWIKPVRFSVGAFVSAIVIGFSLVFLYDFLVGLGVIAVEPSHAILVLLGAILVRTSIVQNAGRGISQKFKRFSVSHADLALLAGFTVFTIILVEVALQLFVLQRLTPANEREFSSLMSTRWPEPLPVVKPEGTIRILGVADSMGVVGGPAENYYYVLEKILRRDFSPNVQMVNISVTGYEPKHELNILPYGMRYSPDVVVESFFVGNDFTLYGEDTFELRGVRINNKPGVSRIRPQNFFLTDLVLNELAYRRDLHQIILEKRNGVVDQVGYLSKEFFDQMQSQRLQFFQPASTDKMKQVFPVLDSIHQVVNSGNARHVIVINPDQTQVDKGLRQYLLTKFHLKEEDYDFDFPQKVVASYCAEKGISCIDLLPAFRANDHDGDLYTTRDGHYSTKGNQVAAAAISQFLVANHLLKPPATQPQVLSSTTKEQ